MDFDAFGFDDTLNTCRSVSTVNDLLHETEKAVNQSDKITEEQ